MNPVPAGQYRHLITIQASTPSRSTRGENRPGWSDVATVRAMVKSLSAAQRAANAASTVNTTATHTIRIRYRPDIHLHPEKYRLALGSIGFEEVTLSDFENMDLPTFEAMPLTGIRQYFRVNAANDVESRRRELILTVTSTPGLTEVA